MESGEMVVGDGKAGPGAFDGWQSDAIRLGVKKGKHTGIVQAPSYAWITIFAATYRIVLSMLQLYDGHLMLKSLREPPNSLDSWSERFWMQICVH